MTLEGLSYLGIAEGGLDTLSTIKKNGVEVM